MTITIHNDNIDLKYSFRAMMIYEKITGTSFNPKGITEIMIYLYSTILASAKDIALTFDEFMDWIDNNPQILTEFSTWLSTILTKNSVMNEGDNNGDDFSKKK